MIQTIEAIVDEPGKVVLLEAIRRQSRPRRAYVTIREVESSSVANETALLIGQRYLLPSPSGRLVRSGGASQPPINGDSIKQRTTTITLTPSPSPGGRGEQTPTLLGVTLIDGQDVAL